jgi:MoaA/NifB/PqqE/SkfB family radical SAM enzyme
MIPDKQKFNRIKFNINKIRRGSAAIYSGFSLERAKTLIRYLYKTKIIGRVIPEVITVGVTYKCQCRCVHCSSNVPNLKGQILKREMSTSQLKEIIDQSVQMGIPRITFFGGEPLMRKDIFELIRYAYDRGLITKINTNALGLKEDVVLKLKQAGLTQCDVSIDDPDAEVHDKLRGVHGLFGKAIQGIELLRKHKILCQIVTYASKRNVTEGLKRIIELGHNLHATGVSIVFPMASGCWHNSYNELLSDDELAKVMELGDSNYVYVEIPSPTASCNVVKKASLYVSPEGNVTPCPFVPWYFGNINSHALNELVPLFYSEYNHRFHGNCLMNNRDARETLQQTINKVNLVSLSQPGCPGAKM